MARYVTQTEIDNCRQKRRYATEGTAIGVGLHSISKRPSLDPKMRTYICPVCGWWHLTKNGSGRKLAEREEERRQCAA